MPNIKVFDTHIHFNNERLIDSFDESIKKDKDFVYNIIGTNLEDSLIAIELAHRYSNTYCSIGIHPCDVSDSDEEKVFSAFKEQLDKKGNKIVAIGEIGFDFHHNKKEDCFEIQKYWFFKQVELAKQYKLPLTLHVRNAYEEMLEELKKIGWYGIIHCFDGSIEQLKDYLTLDGWMISISPLILRNKDKFHEIIKLTPLDRLLIESDAPWLIKDHHAIKGFIETIAVIKNVSIEEASIAIFNNSHKILKV